MTEPVVSGGDVASFLGLGGDATAQAEQHAQAITRMASAYTRGNGFENGAPCPELAAVITTAAARLFSNPEQSDHGAGSTWTRGGFQGWSLAEQAVLNRYRVRAQ